MISKISKLIPLLVFPLILSTTGEAALSQRLNAVSPESPSISVSNGNTAFTNTDSKATPAQKTTATFAAISSGNVISVADAPIIYVPCAPINNNCQQVKNYLTEKIESAKDLSQSSFQDMNTQISQKLLQLRNAQEWRTNLSGIASIDCPTQNCLIYAAFLSENQNLFWLDIHPRESNQEYPPSRAAQAKAETTPTEITALINEINKFNSVTTAGVSYQNFSAHYAPLINALNSASLYANDNKYSVLIKETKRALEMFDVTQDVWQMYIESTDVSTWRTTHNVSCEYAKSIRELWNEIVGHEDIGKIKDGVLGCWGVDLGEFKSPYGRTAWHEYMFSVASNYLRSVSRHLNPSSGTVPNLELPKLQP